MLIELLALGLTLHEAQGLSVEQLLCLLAEKKLRDELAALETEAGRIASLPFADSSELQRALLKIQMQARRAVERHQREY